MFKKLSNLFIYLVASLPLVLASPALARKTTTEFGDFATIGEFMTAVFSNFNKIILGIAIIMVIYAGFLYLTSRGDEKQIDQAKTILIGVISGFLLLAGAGLIIQWFSGSI